MATGDRTSRGRGRRTREDRARAARPAGEWEPPPPPDGIQAVRLSAGGSHVLVLSFPIRREPACGAQAPREARLTNAEREVVTLAATGLRDAEIAARRGRSARTIANQLRAAFAKLGISSRRELLAWLAPETPRAEVGEGESRAADLPGRWESPHPGNPIVRETLRHQIDHESTVRAGDILPSSVDWTSTGTSHLPAPSASRREPE